MELFGFQIKRKKSEEEENKQPNPLRIVADATEPADEISSLGSASGFFATAFDDGSAKITNERELIIQYRTIAEYPEVDLAVNEIVNEAISFDDNDSTVVDIRFDEYNGPKSVREKIIEAFDDTVQLMKLNNKAAELFQRWYIDGRLYFYITPNKEKTDIESVVQLSPFSIRKKREIIKETDPKTRVEFIKSVREYYEYDPSNSSADDKTNRRQTAATKLELTPDSVVAVTSGIRDIHSKVYLSYLHKAIKVANNLRSLEDSLVVYRISRAPERRIFYIDVGNLQKGKADEYMKSIMNRHRNKIVYNSKTGEITSDKNHMSILEDFWLPRREGRSGTEISTLPGGSNLGEIEDLLYMQRKLFRSLNVPIARLEQENQFSFGRVAEISRDEVKFQKFISRLRRNFAEGIIDVLQRVVVIRNIMSASEFEEVRRYISIDFLRDNFFSELKELEIMRERAQLVNELDTLTEKGFISNKWIRTKVLRQTEEDIEEIDKEREQEKPDEEAEDDLDI